MKKTLTRIIVFLAIAIVLSMYILYVMENLPTILQKKGEAEHEQIPPVLNEDTSNILSDDMGNDDAKHDNNKTYDRQSDVTGNSDAEHDMLGAKDTGINQVVTVEDDTWRAVNRGDNYNGELQFYTQDNVILEDGSITIITKKENKGTKNYTSGMVTSKNAYMYGFFSFRIRVSEGKGLFPAIWFLPVEDKGLPEIDIFEMIGSEPLNFYGVIHYGSTAKSQKEYFCHKVKKKEFYDVGIKWTKDELSWYIDEQCVFRTDKGIPNEPMYLIINQAIGGNWPGAPDDTTTLPATFIVESYILEPELIIEL